MRAINASAYTKIQERKFGESYTDDDGQLDSASPASTDMDGAEAEMSGSRSPPNASEYLENDADADRMFLNDIRSKDKRRAWRQRILAVAVVVYLGIVAFVSYNQLFSGTAATVPTGRPPALIVSSYANQDIAWLSKVIGWEIHRYCNDCSHEVDPITGTPILRAPSEMGREANVYLTYIIDHYDTLPPLMLFLHGHERSWHQPEFADLLVRGLNLSAVAQEDYVAIKCTVSTWCTPKAAHDLTQGPIPLHPEGTGIDNVLRMMPSFWQFIFGDEPLPTAFKGIAGGQFAVTAEAVRRHPLSFYKRIREPLESASSLELFDSFLRNLTMVQWGGESSDLEWDTVFGHTEHERVDKYTVGVLFEKFWHRIFGKDVLFCPKREFCNPMFFNDAFDCSGFVETKWLFEGVHTNCSVDEARMEQVQADNLRLGLLPPATKRDNRQPT